MEKIEGITITNIDAPRHFFDGSRVLTVSEVSETASSLIVARSWFKDIDIKEWTDVAIKGDYLTYESVGASLFEDLADRLKLQPMSAKDLDVDPITQKSNPNGRYLTGGMVAYQNGSRLRITTDMTFDKRYDASVEHMPSLSLAEAKKLYDVVKDMYDEINGCMVDVEKKLKDLSSGIAKTINDDMLTTHLKRKAVESISKQIPYLSSDYIRLITSYDSSLSRDIHSVISRSVEASS